MKIEKTGFVLVTNKETGIEERFDLSEYSYSVKFDRKEGFYVFDNKWDKAGYFEYPSEFLSSKSRVTSQISKLSVVGYRIVADLFSLDLSHFRAVANIYAKEKGIKFKTKVNSNKELIVIRIK